MGRVDIIEILRILERVGISIQQLAQADFLEHLSQTISTLWIKEDNPKRDGWLIEIGAS